MARKILLFAVLLFVPLALTHASTALTQNLLRLQDSCVSGVCVGDVVPVPELRALPYLPPGLYLAGTVMGLYMQGQNSVAHVVFSPAPGDEEVVPVPQVGVKLSGGTDGLTVGQNAVAFLNPTSSRYPNEYGPIQMFYRNSTDGIAQVSLPDGVVYVSTQSVAVAISSTALDGYQIGEGHVVVAKQKLSTGEGTISQFFSGKNGNYRFAQLLYSDGTSIYGQTANNSNFAVKSSALGCTSYSGQIGDSVFVEYQNLEGQIVGIYNGSDLSGQTCLFGIQTSDQFLAVDPSLVDSAVKMDDGVTVGTVLTGWSDTPVIAGPDGEVVALYLDDVLDNMSSLKVQFKDGSIQFMEMVGVAVRIDGPVQGLSGGDTSVGLIPSTTGKNPIFAEGVVSGIYANPYEQGRGNLMRLTINGVDYLTALGPKMVAGPLLGFSVGDSVGSTLGTYSGTVAALYSYGGNDDPLKSMVKVNLTGGGVMFDFISNVGKVE